MKSLALFLLVTPLSFYQDAHKAWEKFISENPALEETARELPEYDYIQRDWRRDSEIVVTPVNPFLMQEKAFRCPDETLYPTHPQQITKEYHYGSYSEYETPSLNPHSMACITPNPGKKYCLRSDIPKKVIMSDLYQDRCGNFYRAFWMVAYLKRDENMGTLFAKGRTAYEKPNSPFANDFEMGGTYSLSRNEFFLLTEISEKEEASIKAYKELAFEEGFTTKDLLFVKDLFSRLSPSSSKGY